ncbi:unnamed protein product, partial [Phaeothamnion confervicola]
MREGIVVCDRIYSFKAYEGCFTGADAVTWMVAADVAGSPNEALEIGRRLMEFGLIDHVMGDHRFKDEPIFYQFKGADARWESVQNMSDEAAKAMAYRMNLELEMADHRAPAPAAVTDDNGENDGFAAEGDSSGE